MDVILDAKRNSSADKKNESELQKLLDTPERTHSEVNGDLTLTPQKGEGHRTTNCAENGAPGCHSNDLGVVSNIYGDPEAGKGKLVDEEEEEDEGEDEDIVRDGGWGWVVCFGAFMISFIIDGTLFSFGILMLELVSDLGQDKSTTSWIGSAQMGLHMIMGPVISGLLQIYSIRQVVLAGTVLSSAAFIVSVFSPNVYFLIFSYGVVGGIGFGMVFLPALIVVVPYFNKRRAIATGIATSGSGLGMFGYAFIMDNLMEHFNWRGTVLLLAALLLHCFISGLLFRPLRPTKSKVRITRYDSKSSISNSQSAHKDKSTYEATYWNKIPRADSQENVASSCKGEGEATLENSIYIADREIVPKTELRAVPSGDCVDRERMNCDPANNGCFLGGCNTNNAADCKESGLRKDNSKHKTCYSSDLVINLDGDSSLAVNIPASSVNNVDSNPDKTFTNDLNVNNTLESQLVSTTKFMCDNSLSAQVSTEVTNLNTHNARDNLNTLYGNKGSNNDSESNRVREVPSIESKVPTISGPQNPTATSKSRVNGFQNTKVLSNTEKLENPAISSLKPLTSARMYQSADHIHHIMKRLTDDKDAVDGTLPTATTTSRDRGNSVDNDKTTNKNCNNGGDTIHHSSTLLSPPPAVSSTGGHRLSTLSPGQAVSLYGINGYRSLHPHHQLQEHHHNHGTHHHQHHHDHVGGSRAELVEHINKGLLHPMLRKDIFYSGSVQHLSAYQQHGSMTSFLAAMTKCDSAENVDVITDTAHKKGSYSFLNYLKSCFPMHLMRDRMFLLLLLTFVMWTGQTITMTYLPSYAVSVGIDRSRAASLISIIGVSNVLGRLLAGFITDCLPFPSTWLYCLALTIGALVNFFIPNFTNYHLLAMCAAIFGLCMAVAVSMRTIVLADQMGVEVLTQSFGIVALFQGVFFIVIPPIAGSMIDTFESSRPSFWLAAGMYTVSAISILIVACLGKSREDK